MTKLSAKLTLEELRRRIPAAYELVELMGYGSFGQVVKCRRKDTGELVAIKVPCVHQNTNKEENFLKTLMKKGMDQRNVVNYYGSFPTRFGRAMIFEALECDLFQYIQKQPTRQLPLSDIRDIIRQLAVALDGLKEEEIIHGDLKLSNVMLVNSDKPLQVKLIDFGLGMYRKKALKGKAVGNVNYRSPESILGVKLTEALDVWSLGVIAVTLAIGRSLFPLRSDFETLKVIDKLLGPIPEKLLHKGFWSFYYYTKEGKKYRLRTEDEFMESCPNEQSEIRSFYAEEFTSLEELIKAFVAVKDQREAEELDLFIDLVSKMLKVDAEERITPAQILKHPFICDWPRKERRRIFSVTSGSSMKSFRPLPEQKDDFRKCDLLTSDEIKKLLPDEYKFIKLQGTVQSGQIFKCESIESKEVFSVKLPRSGKTTQKEIQLMKRAMIKGLDKESIVQCTAILEISSEKALVYELLDMNLTRYLAAHHPLALGDVRFIVQQTATALKALKSMSVIHTEVTLDNMWLCAQGNHLEVKLTDFQSSIHSKSAQPGMTLQSLNYRAPEIILGLPFNEAIDVWSLGTMMASMLLGFDLFPKRSEFETLKIMVKYFGQPSDDTLSKGLKTQHFFIKHGESWRLMTDEEYVKRHHLESGDIQVYQSENFSTFDELIRANFPAHCLREKLERERCIRLMYQMLKMEDAHRITPAQIIEHLSLFTSIQTAQTSTPGTSGRAPRPITETTTTETTTSQTDTAPLPKRFRILDHSSHSSEGARQSSSGCISQTELSEDESVRDPKTSDTGLSSESSSSSFPKHTFWRIPVKQKKTSNKCCLYRFCRWLRKHLFCSNSDE